MPRHVQQRGAARVARHRYCQKHASARFSRGIDADPVKTQRSCTSTAVLYEPTATNTSNGSINRYYDPATGQFLSIDPLVESTQQPYQYSNDDPVNLKDPTGLWWCLAQGVSGPCPAGYTNSPPYGMSNPQPPNSQVQAGGNGTYQLTLSDGETFTYTTNGGIVGGETAATGQAPCNPNSPTTNQEWNQFVGGLDSSPSPNGAPWYINGPQTLQGIYNFLSNHPPGGGGPSLTQLYQAFQQWWESGAPLPW